jgi:preprotein translocase subunit YajC
MQTGLLFVAQAAGGAQPSMMPMLVTMVLVFGIFYFMMIRPQQRKEKERQKMISEMRAGQRVLFANGMLGTVVESRTHTFLIEIASGVRVEVARGAVSRVLKDGEAAAMEQQG